MDNHQWIQRWREGRTPFHLEQVNPWLLHYQHLLEPLAGCSALVPLCGMSMDMDHLAGAGARVTGVDVAEQPLRQFLQVRNLDAIQQSQAGTPVFRAGPFTLLAGDFLQASANLAGPWDVIWDRAALIALPDHQRRHYADLLLRLLAPGGRILLVGLEYDDSLMDGPPYNVPAESINELFKAAGTVQMLACKELDKDNLQQRIHDLTWVKETVFLITATHEDGRSS